MPGHQPEQAHQGEERGGEFSRERRLQDPDARRLGSTGTGLVHLHVVAVTVAALRIVAEQHVSVFFADQGGELRGGLTGVRACEPHPVWRVGIQQRPVPAVRIAQMHNPGGAQP